MAEAGSKNPFLEENGCWGQNRVSYMLSMYHRASLPVQKHPYPCLTLIHINTDAWLSGCPSWAAVAGPWTGIVYVRHWLCSYGQCPQPCTPTAQACLQIAPCYRDRYTGCHKHFHAQAGGSFSPLPFVGTGGASPIRPMAFLSNSTLPSPSLCLSFTSNAACCSVRHCFLNPNLKLQYVLFSFLAHGIFTMSSSESVSESTIQ